MYTNSTIATYKAYKVVGITVAFYNAVYCIEHISSEYPIARPWGRELVYIFWRALI